jgi:hypothetical protein
MAYIHKTTKHGIGWQKDTTNSVEGAAPAPAHAFLLLPVNAQPTFDGGYEIQQDDKFHGAPYLKDGVGMDLGRPADAPYNPSLGFSCNVNLDLLKRLFVAQADDFGSDLGAGSSGTCYEIECPTSGFSYRFSTQTNSAATSRSLMYAMEDAGKWMGTCLPRSFTVDFPADGSPATITADLAAGRFGDNETSTGWTFGATTTASHADFGGQLVEAAYTGISPHSGAGMSVTFTMDVEQSHNGYRNPQDLNAHRWSVTARIGDIDHESVLFNQWQAGTIGTLTLQNAWDEGTMSNNGPENWKINIPNMRVVNNPQLEGEGRMYTSIELEAVHSDSEPPWEFFYCDTWTTW